jgi:hypothetical protein
MLSLDVILAGPSLDQLDYWGTIDTLLWPLDSPVWLEAEIIAMSGEDEQPARDFHGQCFFLSFLPIEDRQLARDTASLSFKGHGWIPVPRPGLEQWREYAV